LANSRLNGLGGVANGSQNIGDEGGGRLVDELPLWTGGSQELRTGELEGVKEA
jgi:hypothetical protein